MDFFSAMNVSASGLNAQMQRMGTISENLANAETTETVEGGPYRRKDPVFVAQPENDSFEQVLDNKIAEQVQKVQVADIHRDERAPRLVYNPSHPHANADGYVAMPNVNPTEEMANMISAQRSYEANISAMNAAKGMAQKALEIGR